MNQATLDFIQQHLHDDVRKLALQGAGTTEVDMQQALQQIAGRQKARAKLPSWAAVDGVLYPPHLSLEQCSSELTAKYKASIAGVGDLIVDLTAGFGVDIGFMSPRFRNAVHVEQQAQLCAISKNNFRTLGLTNIEVVSGDGVEYLHTMNHADLIFIDPARRDEHGGRTYGIADCTPNVLTIRDEMLEKADRVIVKLSPMLDWRKAVADLAKVYAVHIVSVDNECKELLVEMRDSSLKKEDERPSLPVVCINLLSAGGEERFEFDAKQVAPPIKHCVDQNFRYLYEPNASIMKAGCFSLIAEYYGICQLDDNSHLFVSESEVPDFPGRSFVIDSITSMNKRELKAALVDVSQANISVRNFPMSVVELRKRLKLKEGGSVYIFATTTANHEHLLFVCRKKS